HHVLIAQQSAAMLQQPYFVDVTRPGHHNGWQQLSATLTLAQHTGISLSQILYRLADALEAGVDAHQARQAASAGPQAPANLLAWLPVAGVGLVDMLGASVPHVLTTPTGWVILSTGAALAIAGRRWTSRMMETAEVP